MLQPRSYRPALTKKEALATIKGEAGKKWNENLINNFFDVINEDE